MSRISCNVLEERHHSASGRTLTFQYPGPIPYFQFPRSLGKIPGKTHHHTHTRARASKQARPEHSDSVCPPPLAPQHQADLLEEVPLASGREGHLPARGQRQLVGHIVGLLAKVRVLLRGATRSARAGAQLQGRGRRVRANVLGSTRQPGPRVAAGGVGARLARVRA